MIPIKYVKDKPQHFGLASRCHHRPRELTEDSGEHCCSSASDRMIKIDALHSTETGNTDVAFANERFGDVTELGVRKWKNKASEFCLREMRKKMVYALAVGMMTFSPNLLHCRK